MSIRERKLLQTETPLNSEFEWRGLCYDCNSVDLLRAAARQFAKKETKEQKELDKPTNVD